MELRKHGLKSCRIEKHDYKTFNTIDMILIYEDYKGVIEEVRFTSHAKKRIKIEVGKIIKHD